MNRQSEQIRRHTLFLLLGAVLMLMLQGPAHADRIKDLAKGGVANNFVTFKPRASGYVVVSFKIPRRREYGWNQKRWIQRKLPKRRGQALLVPPKSNQCWSADFMSDALYQGSRFRLFNVNDDFNRESVAIEVDTSLRSERLVRVFERLKSEGGLPGMLRVDNGPEFLGQVFVDWCQSNGVFIDHIEPGKPNQNAFIERFNRSVLVKPPLLVARPIRVFQRVSDGQILLRNQVIQ